MKKKMLSAVLVSSLFVATMAQAQTYQPKANNVADQVSQFSFSKDGVQYSAHVNKLQMELEKYSKQAGTEDYEYSAREIKCDREYWVQKYISTDKDGTEHYSDWQLDDTMKDFSDCPDQPELRGHIKVVTVNRHEEKFIMQRAVWAEFSKLVVHNNAKIKFADKQKSCVNEQLQNLAEAEQSAEFQTIIKQLLGVTKIDITLQDNTIKAWADKTIPYGIDTRTKGLLMIRAALNSKGDCVISSKDQLLAEMRKILAEYPSAVQKMLGLSSAANLADAKSDAEAAVKIAETVQSLPALPAAQGASKQSVNN